MSSNIFCFACMFDIVSCMALTCMFGTFMVRTCMVRYMHSSLCTYLNVQLCFYDCIKAYSTFCYMSHIHTVTPVSILV